jgi:NADH-quinone oxidoreductase subunit N
MAIELASIPTYVLVAMSRPLPAAQEAGVKYFYLGAMSAAVMLLGFAYLYGATGTTNLGEIATAFGTGTLSDALGGGTWKALAVVLVLLGFCFKLAAFPLHFYAGDVYTGAATPVTALLSFVPKATGILATLKVLSAVGTGGATPAVWATLLVVSVLTMTVGNTMALLTENVKRVMAYSSIAHSGYMLAALTVLAAGEGIVGRPGQAAAAGVLFYLAAYGVMNAGVFGVLMMLPTRKTMADQTGTQRLLPATSAETYRDIRGAGRSHPLLGGAMAVCCISLIGIPITVGFLGKIYVITPAVLLAQAAPEVATAMWILIAFVALNAAVAAAYYLRILVEMMLSKSAEEEEALAEGQVYQAPKVATQPWPIVTAVTLSAGGALFLGGLIPGALNTLTAAADEAAVAARFANAVVVVPDQRPPPVLGQRLSLPPAGPVNAGATRSID